jgi:hypothetical protein
MDTLLIAKLIGPLWLLAGLGFLINRKFYMEVVKDLKQHNGMIYIGGAFIFLLGLYLVLNHNVWEMNLNGFITLIVWGMLIKGAALLLIPMQLLQVSDCIMKSKNGLMAAGGIAFLAGAILTYFAYFAA